MPFKKNLSEFVPLNVLSIFLTLVFDTKHEWLLGPVKLQNAKQCRESNLYNHELHSKVSETIW